MLKSQTVDHGILQSKMIVANVPKQEYVSMKYTAEG